MFVALEPAGAGGKRREPPSEGGSEDGCAFLVEASGGSRACGVPRRPGSPYCPEHHALCHVANGSPGEQRRLGEAEALAKAVGGRQGRNARQPSEQFLRRLDRASRRPSSRAKRSCYVRGDQP